MPASKIIWVSSRQPGRPHLACFRWLGGRNVKVIPVVPTVPGKILAIGARRLKSRVVFGPDVPTQEIQEFVKEGFKPSKHFSYLNMTIYEKEE